MFIDSNFFQLFYPKTYFQFSSKCENPLEVNCDLTDIKALNSSSDLKKEKWPPKQSGVKNKCIFVRPSISAHCLCVWGKLPQVLYSSLWGFKNISLYHLRQRTFLIHPCIWNKYTFWVKYCKLDDCIYEIVISYQKTCVCGKLWKISHSSDGTKWVTPVYLHEEREGGAPE